MAVSTLKQTILHLALPRLWPQKLLLPSGLSTNHLASPWSHDVSVDFGVKRWQVLHMLSGGQGRGQSLRRWATMNLPVNGPPLRSPGLNHCGCTVEKRTVFPTSKISDQRLWDDKTGFGSELDHTHLDQAPLPPPGLFDSTGGEWVYKD